MMLRYDASLPDGPSAAFALPSVRGLAIGLCKASNYPSMNMYGVMYRCKKNCVSPVGGGGTWTFLLHRCGGSSERVRMRRNAGANRRMREAAVTERQSAVMSACGPLWRYIYLPKLQCEAEGSPAY